MSVGRDIIAKVQKVAQADVRCSNCKRSEAFGGGLWCNGWNGRTKADEFCSFFISEWIEPDEEDTDG